jgi:hypothetical protein
MFLKGGTFAAAFACREFALAQNLTEQILDFQEYPIQILL